MKASELTGLWRPVLGLLLAVVLAGSQPAAAGDSTARAWQWLPYNEDLPTYALAISIAAHPADPNLLYAGTYEPPGLWCSRDGGKSWQADDQGLGGSPVYAVYWDAERSRWWAGTRDGIYAHASAGAAWWAAGLRDHVIYAIGGDERGVLYAGTDRGLFRSADGRRWDAVEIAEAQAPLVVLAVAVSEDGSRLLLGSAAQGVWASRDRGATWSHGAGPQDAGPQGIGLLNDQLSALEESSVPAVLLDERHKGTAYAGTVERAYRSVDDGATWQPVSGLELQVHAFAIGADARIYAALTGQVARSSDGGHTWERHGVGPADDKVLGLAVSRADPASIYAAGWSNLYVSRDGGQQWGPAGEGAGYPDVNVLARDNAGRLLAGTRSGLYRRGSDQRAWQPVGSLNGRPVLALASAGDGLSFYAGLSGGLARSIDGASSWTEVASELTDVGFAGLVVGAAEPAHLLAWIAFGRVHESADGGRSWAARWEGLGDVRPVTAIHRTAGGVLFAGAEDGLFRWEPKVTAWQLLPLPLCAPTVFELASDPRDPKVIYAGATDGLWRSQDGGETWRRWGKGLDGLTVTAVALSPRDARVAFAGTRHAGLFVTGDGGASWEAAWDGKSAGASVRDILFSPDGRSVYVASDQGIWRGDARGGS